MNIKIKKILFSAVLAGLIALLAFLMYAVSVLWRSSEFYKSEKRWSENILRESPRYGFEAIPGKTVFHTLSSGAKTPVLFNEDGFRVPPEDPLNHDGWPKILFLGCSFTHGYGVPAEKTFSYLAGIDLNAQALNAGVPGWGLSQMLLKAEEIIPAVKPDIVVVQYSKWLPERSSEFYAPFNFGKTPIPYFYAGSNGEVAIHPPVFTPVVYDLPVEKYLGSGLIPFSWHISSSLIPHDDFYSCMVGLRKTAGTIPAPSKNYPDMVNYAYGKISEICKENNSQMYILKLYGSIKDNVPVDLSKINRPIIDTFESLASKLREKTEAAWKKQFCFYDESKKKVIDSHPNELEHRIIADEIVAALKKQKTEDSNPKPE